MTAVLEHANVTVNDPDATADFLCRVFDWHVRWKGPSMMGGHTVHVGTDDTYLAVYTTDEQPGPHSDSNLLGGLQHLGILVDNLDTIEERIRAEGIEPFSFMTYEPGRRFYFIDANEIEFEVVAYDV